MLGTLDLEYEVRSASTEECVAILSEPRLLQVVGVTSREELLALPRSATEDFLLVKYAAYTCLFYARESVAGVYEVHVACPKASIVANRVLLRCIIHWVFATLPDSKAIVTTCPEGKIANTVRKLGFEETLREEDGMLLFMLFKHNLM